jgi:hypothetical protein
MALGGATRTNGADNRLSLLIPGCVFVGRDSYRRRRDVTAPVGGFGCRHSKEICLVGIFLVVLDGSSNQLRSTLTNQASIFTGNGGTNNRFDKNIVLCESQLRGTPGHGSDFLWAMGATPTALLDLGIHPIRALCLILKT